MLGRIARFVAVPVVPGSKAFKDGNLADFTDRWRWIDKELWPAWEKLAKDKPSAVAETMDRFINSGK
jgi:hypothetical protein